MVRVGIVGSRTFNNYCFLAEVVAGYLQAHNLTPSVIVSGGADGADALAERYAREHNIPLQIYPADWKRYGRSAGAKRNQEIVNMSDILIAFRVSNSAGTTITINMARTKGISVHVVEL